MFESGRVYIADYAGNVSKPYVSTQKALEDAVDSDTILIAVSAKACRIKKKEEKKPVIKELIINFDDNVISITGGIVQLGKYKFAEGVSNLTEEQLKSWEDIIKDAYKICDKTLVRGTPPAQGEYLNALLYM